MPRAGARKAREIAGRVVGPEIVKQEEGIEEAGPRESPKTRFRCTPAPSIVGLLWMIFLIVRCLFHSVVSFILQVINSSLCMPLSVIPECLLSGCQYI